MSDVLDRVAYVTALDVPPNAVLVAKSDRRLTVAQAETIREQLLELFPGRKVLVLPPELELDVVRETDS